MTKKERIRDQIEEERKKLNSLVAEKSRAEEIYAQSLLVDRLLEQYMDCE